MTDTAVVGAGIGGLAMGALLARAGHAVTVYEQRAVPSGGGAAVGLHPNGLAVLDAIGVLGVLRAAGSELRRLRWLDDRLRVITEIDVPGGDDDGYVLVVERAVLLEALAEAAVAAGATMKRERRVHGVGGGPLSPVLELGDGSRPFALVVGADGVGSVVRQMVSPDHLGRGGRNGGGRGGGGRRYVRAVVDWVCSEQLAGEYWTRRGMAGLLPCGEGKTYWYATATDAMARAVKAADAERIRRSVAVAHPPLVQVVNALTSASQVQLDRVPQVEVEQLYKGLVVLIGDAAHTIAPSLPQGANTALLDSAVLASELYRRDSLTAALAAYDARRCPAVHQVQRDAERLARAAHFTRGRRARNAALRVVGQRFVAAAVRRSQQIDLAGLRSELRHLP